MTLPDFVVNETAKLFKALAQADRLRILYLIAQGELCQCELVDHLTKSQSTVSTHLRRLVEQGILTVREDGQRRLYKIADPEVRDILDRGRAVISRAIQTKADNLAHAQQKR